MDGLSTAGSAGGYEVGLLGGFSIRRGRYPLSVPPTSQRLIAFLALHPRQLARAYVAGSLWPNSTQSHADASLRSTLWRMRGSCTGLIRASTTHVTLTDSLTIDVRAVVELVRRLMDPCRSCSGNDLDPAALSDELLPGWAADDWVYFERERLRQLCMHGLEAQSMRLLDLGRYGEAVEAGIAALRAEPLRESAHRLLIQIHLAEGNITEALRQFHWYRRLLRSELGLDPSITVLSLFHPIRSVEGKQLQSLGSGGQPATDSADPAR